MVGGFLRVISGEAKSRGRFQGKCSNTLGNAEGSTKEAREQTEQAGKPTNTENFRSARQICTVN